jgi:hypothetical protein
MSQSREPKDYWGENPSHPVADWQYAVANGDTRHGYWEWVESEIEAALADRA